MKGSLDEYLVIFGIHSLFKGETGFVSAEVVQPTDIEWTQVLPQANTYNLSTLGSFPKLVVESTEPVHTFGFIFNVVHTGDIPDGDFEDLTATVKVYGDNSEVQTFQYTARPVGEATYPLSETIRF
ncbi:hypothetical protein [Lunatibacter salilacus]|uniref:hypothetical protein n=1 Tax=Lunatibacter salilacus TaxID=2483804 RepID=UPI001F41A93C|nr:hypothetical protein [Lunatibacter salilacus]